MTGRDRELHVGALTRVEGEGALHVDVVDGQVRAVQLRLYEPPRFFEAFLRGRHAGELTDLTARVCGICPVAYQTSAWNAVEALCGVEVGPRIAALRRLLYCGEWISSHALHVHLLHAPDFLGLPDAMTLARQDPRSREAVERGLRIKQAGNAILEAVGGRAIHPVNPRLGGFHRAPTAAELEPLVDRLRRALDDALAATTWVAGFDAPDVEVDHELVALTRPDTYAVEDGRIATTGGLTLDVADLGRHVVEHQVPWSNALHAELDGRRYLTGPLARYTLNSSRLSPTARRAAADAGLGPTCRNPYRSIVVRMVEVVHALDEALRLIRGYERPSPAAVDVPLRAGTGHGASEAPRGLLHHRYDLDAEGRVLAASLMPPTSQNQAAIEHDLAVVVADHLDLDDAALTALCERTIRHHDPCISCAAHFLDLRVRRRRGPG